MEFEENGTIGKLFDIIYGLSKEIGSKKPKIVYNFFFLCLNNLFYFKIFFWFRYIVQRKNVLVGTNYLHNIFKLNNEQEKLYFVQSRFVNCMMSIAFAIIIYLCILCQ